MKNILFVAFILSAIVLIGACKKEDKGILLKGQLKKASDSTVYANTSFVLYQRVNHSVNKFHEEKVPITTDVNGFFNANFNMKISNSILICWPDKVSDDTYIIEVAVPYGTSGEYDFGAIYLK